MTHAIPWRRLAAASLLAAAQAATPAGAAGTLTFCSSDAPEGFDPAQHETNTTVDAAGLPLYDTLLTLRADTGELRPALAESWQVGADGLAVSFKLRRGVKFHTTPWFTPTRELNAQDVLFTFHRMMDKAHWAHAAARRGFPNWAGTGLGGLVRAIDAPDPMTVRFTLARPDVPFLTNLAIAPIGAVLSAEYATRLAAAGKLEQLDSQPVGTGPFVFRSYQGKSVIRYVPHPTYWAGAPKLDQMVFTVTIDPEVRLQRLKAGECVAAMLAAETAHRLEGVPGLQVLNQQALVTNMVSLNTQRAPLRDRRMREALALAIDREAIAQQVYAGRAAVASTLLPRSMWSHDASLLRKPDLARARELARAGGYGGEELVLFVIDTATTRRFGEMLQADWARAGIKVTLRTMDQAELFKRSAEGEHDLVLHGWFSDNGDPDNFLAPNASCAAVQGGSNKARWCHEGFDRLLDEARRNPDRNRRAELYRQAQRVMHDEVPIIPLLYPLRFVGLSARVQGYEPNPFDLHDFRHTSIKP